MSKLTGITIFSIVETLTVVAWGAILGVGAGLPLAVQIAAGLVLFAGYEVEHIIAFNVGRGKPILQNPDRP